MTDEDYEDAKQVAKRGIFAFQRPIYDKNKPWEILARNSPDGFLQSYGELIEKTDCSFKTWVLNAEHYMPLLLEEIETLKGIINDMQIDSEAYQMGVKAGMIEGYKQGCEDGTDKGFKAGIDRATKMLDRWTGGGGE